jgi:adenylate cyclase
LKATGHSDPSGPWIPVGIGIHSGQTLVGSVGAENGLTQISILGDTANTAARLASLAKTGEILISDEAAQNAEIDTKNLEKRQLDLKGKSEPVTAWVINVGA